MTGGATATDGSFVADACGEAPLPDLVRYNLERLRAIGYLSRFGGYARQLGLSEGEIAELPTASSRRIGDIAKAAGDRSGWLANPESHLAAVGCGLVLVVGEDGGDSLGATPPDPAWILDAYAILKADIRLLVGIDPHRPESLDRALALSGHPRFGGLALSPFLAGMRLDDEGYAPSLAAAADRDLVVWVHCSAHFRPGIPYDIGHPRHLDGALARWPGLRLLFGHAGWPWTDEACIVALRHGGTALEHSTFPPSLLADPGWSLSALLSQRSALRGRIFFGSGGASSPRRMARLVAELDQLALGEDLARWRGAGLSTWLNGSAT